MSEVNLKKISEVLGLSISTVSRALKNHPDISTQTKRRVMETAETLHYVPNLNAVNLRNKNSRVFGVMIPSITNSFYVSFINALEEEVRKNNYSLMILQSGDNPGKELEIINTYRQNRIQGLFACISPSTTEIENFKNLYELEIPVLFFDKLPIDEDCIKVCIDDEHAAETAINELLKNNKKNILALFGNKNLSITKSRLAAFNNIVSKNPKITCNIEHCTSSNEAKNVSYQHFRKKNKPDAVFCMSDEILIGVMKTIQELKINYPSDAGIIALSEGYFPKIYYPEITYVETSGAKLGKICFEKMIELVNKQEGHNNLKVPSILVSGGSL